MTRPRCVVVSSAALVKAGRWDADFFIHGGNWQTRDKRARLEARKVRDAEEVRQAEADTARMESEDAAAFAEVRGLVERYQS